MPPPSKLTQRLLFGTIMTLALTALLILDAYLGTRNYFFTRPNMAGLGFTILVPDYEAADDEVRFSLDFYGGFLYEVVDNLGIGAVFNIGLPNIAPREDWEVAVGRFSVMGTVAYFFNL